jgi:hypothetical protein
MVSRREYSGEKKACQYNLLEGQREKKIGRYSPMKIS